MHVATQNKHYLKKMDHLLKYGYPVKIAFEVIKLNFVIKKFLCGVGCKILLLPLKYSYVIKVRENKQNWKKKPQKTELTCLLFCLQSMMDKTKQMCTETK